MFKKNTNYFYAVRIIILLAILFEILIQIGYFLWAPAQRKRATILYFANVFIYLFIYLWPSYSPAMVNGGSRKFYTW